MSRLICLLVVVCASASWAQEKVPDDQSGYLRWGIGSQMGKLGSWGEFQNSQSLWQMFWDAKQQGFSRFDIAFVPGKEKVDASFRVGFSADLPNRNRPLGLYPRFLPEEEARIYLLGEWTTNHLWAEGRFPVATETYGVRWAWSLDLRRFNVGETKLFGLPLRGLVKAGYHSDTGGYAGVGASLDWKQFQLSVDSVDGLSAVWSTKL